MGRIRFVILLAGVTVLMLHAPVQAEATTGSPSKTVDWTALIVALITLVGTITVAWITYSPRRERLKSRVTRLEGALLKDELDLGEVIDDEADLQKSVADEKARRESLELQMEQQQLALEKLRDAVTKEQAGRGRNRGGNGGGGTPPAPFKRPGRPPKTGRGARRGASRNHGGRNVRRNARTQRQG